MGSLVMVLGLGLCRLCGFMVCVWGLGFGFWGLGFEVQGLGVSGYGDLGFSVYGLCVRVYWFEAWGLGFWV